MYSSLFIFKYFPRSCIRLHQPINTLKTSNYPSNSLSSPRAVSLCQQCGQHSRHLIYLKATPCRRRFGVLTWRLTHLSKFNRSYCTKVVESATKHKSNVKLTQPRTLAVGEMRKLLGLAQAEKWNLTGAIFLLFISSTITMAVPFALGKVIDLIYSSDPDHMKSNLNALCLILVAVFAVGGVCNFGRVYLMNISGQRITKMLRERVFNSVMKQEVAFFDKNKTGELINRLSADTSLVSQCVTMNISDGLRALVMTAAGISMMFYMSVELACVSLLIVPPIAGMAIIYGRFIRNMSKKVQDALAEATQVAEERIANIRTVKAFSKEEAEMTLYKNRMEHILKLADREALARGIFFGSAGLSGNILVLTVLYYGGVMVSGETMSVGDLSAFLLYAAYIGISLGSLSSFYSEMNRGLGASTRLWEIIEKPSLIPISGGIRPTWEPAGEIAFEKVSFAYPCRSDSVVVKNLSLMVPKSSITAVVGSSGSGKSTLGALLLRLYDPQEGEVKLDGVNITEYDPSWLHSHIGVVSQEPVLFSGTIKENILYGASNPDKITEQEIDKVMHEANVSEFVHSLSDGLNTLVGERGIMLSGGQKQRIAIARALIKNPRILLLDEATSALDAESEHLVQEALERVMKGRTVLTIAHRLSTIKNADRIAVVDQGQIVELGSYTELIKNESGVFRNLVKHQTFQGN